MRSNPDETSSLCSTGVVYDQRMGTYFCRWDETHVETPDRFWAVLNRCKELDLISGCVRLDSRFATVEELSVYHSASLIQELAATKNEEDLNVLKTASARFDCVYFHAKSYESALLAAGSSLVLTEAVLTGKILNGMAIIRPPGHHADRDKCCGYCYFNNAVLSARKALDYGLKKILIVDWDVHHGQATQQVFYDDPRVLYFSIHRYEYGKWWPNLRESEFDYIGSGNGRGFNINIPLNETANQNIDYISIFLHILLPVAFEFQPELIIVSAGFDAAIGCPEGEQEVSPSCFGHMTHMLKAFAGGKLVVLLEGGYFLPSLAESAAITLKTLMGRFCPKLSSLQGTPRSEIIEVIQNATSVLQQYWKCFQILPIVEATEIRWQGPDFVESSPFDIMCSTPSRSPEIDLYYKKALDQMMASVELRTPTQKLIIICHPENLQQLEMYKLAICISIKNATELNRVLEAEKFEVAVCILRSVTELFDISPLSRKILYIKIWSPINEMLPLPSSSKYGLRDDDQLYMEIVLSKNYPRVKHVSKNEINLVLCNAEKQDENESMIHALYRLILPIGYQFNPDITILFFDGFRKETYPRCFSTLVHHLSNLGRFVMLFDHFCQPMITEIAINTLLMQSVERITPVSGGVFDAENINVIKVAREKSSKYWPIINY